MKKLLYITGILILSIVHCFALNTDSIKWGVFGKIKIYFPATDPVSVVLFISGDGGWDQYVENMSKHLINEGAVVIGIDIRTYYLNLNKLKSSCYYPAGDLEELSLSIQRKYKLKQYLKPVLVGYSAGATLVYGALAQAPANTFKGVIALSFSPDIELNKPLCKGSGLAYHPIKANKLYYLEPALKLNSPLFILQGTNDKVCPLKEVENYIYKLPNTELITLPNVGHGFSVHAYWSPQFLTAFHKILNSPTFTQEKENENILLKKNPVIPISKDLPITLIPAIKTEGKPLAILISGDGGWTSFDQSISEQLSLQGIPVVGFDSQKYFWDEKTPEQTANDINKLINYYSVQWGYKSFILIGYSFGADIVPFLANRITEELKNSFCGVFMLSPDTKGDFEVHITDMLNLGISSNKYDIIQEVEKCKKNKTVCLFGDQENVEDKTHFEKTGAKIIVLKGSHHYNNNFRAVADSIVNNINDL